VLFSPEVSGLSERVGTPPRSEIEMGHTGFTVNWRQQNYSRYIMAPFVHY